MDLVFSLKPPSISLKARSSVFLSFLVNFHQCPRFISQSAAKHVRILYELEGKKKIARKNNEWDKQQIWKGKCCEVGQCWRSFSIYEPESSGKTTLALHAIAEVQKSGGNVLLVDAKHAFDPAYSKALGVSVV